MADQSEQTLGLKETGAWTKRGFRQSCCLKPSQQNTQPRSRHLNSVRSWVRVKPTRGSRVLMSLNLLPLRFRCVRFTSRSARTSRPPDILLSLNSNCTEEQGNVFKPTGTTKSVLVLIYFFSTYDFKIAISKRQTKTKRRLFHFKHQRDFWFTW